MEAKFKVFRHNPEKEAKPRYDEFTLNVEKWTTVLDALETIKHEQNGTLTFRRSCRSGICGSCAMRINGYSKLACKTLAIEEMSKRDVILIEPLCNMPAIKDLVVDMKLFWDKIQEATPWLVEKEKEPNPNKPNLVLKEQLETANKMADCIMCGACVSDCISLEFDKNFLAPAALAKAYRFVSDPRDKLGLERVEKLIDLGLWTCTHCHFCVSQCPRDVGPMYAISTLRVMSIRKGLINNVGARHVNAFADSIKKGGMLNEATLYLRTMRLGTVGEFGLILSMLKKGKAPSPFAKTIPNIAEVRQIYEATETKK